MAWQIAAILTLLVLLLSLLFLLPRIFPVPQRVSALVESREELRRRYQKWDILTGLGGIVFGLLGGLLGWLACRAICSWRTSELRGDYLLLPDPSLCLFAAVSLGVILGIGISWAVAEQILGEGFREFKAYGSLRMGFNVPRFLGWMVLILSLFGLAGIILPANTYLVSSNSGIRFSRLFEIREHQYSYQDIQSIWKEYRTRGRSEPSLVVRIDFKDGQRWDSRNMARVSNEQTQALLEYISDASLVPIISLPQ